MDEKAQLVLAVGGIWGVLTTVVTAGFKFLLDDRKQLKADAATAQGKCDTKLDASAAVILRQNDSMQKQIDAQSAMIAALQELARNGR